MKITSAIFYLLIGTGIGIIVASDFHCEGSKDTVTTTSDTSITNNQTTDSTVQGTKGKDSLVYVPIPIYLSDTFLQSVDSGAIIRDYFQTKVYTNRYITDQLDETIIDTVTGNAITGRKRLFTVTCYDTTINTVTTITKSSDGLYLGAETNLNLIGPDIQFIKGRWSYGGNVKFDPSEFKAKELNLRINYKLIGK